MGINRDKPDLWKEDIKKSVDLYNDWFMNFAPKTFRETRIETSKHVEEALQWTNYLKEITPDMMMAHPSVLSMLRMSTCPPIARDRLIGLSGVQKSVVDNMEKNKRLPQRMKEEKLREELSKIGKTIRKMADPDIFTWLENEGIPTEEEMHRAATIVADRLCGSFADPIIRNAQESRQLDKISTWLNEKNYRRINVGEGIKFDKIPAGSYAYHLNVPVSLEGGETQINVSVDALIMPHSAKPSDLPILIEAKSAGDFTNVNKRRKEEAVKMAQLRSNYGDKIKYLLFLCGYFDSGYLGYEASEGIDWIWEHRLDDLDQLGL